MSTICHFCKQEVVHEGEHSRTMYDCKRCGPIFISPELIRDIDLDVYQLSDDEAHILSVMLRGDFEKFGKPYRRHVLTHDVLDTLLSLYRPKDPIEKIDTALLNFEKSSNYVGSPIEIDFKSDYPLYDCRNPSEARSICFLTQEEGLTDAPDPEQNPFRMFRITSKGYERLRKIKSGGKLSNQCFVAMWFGKEVEHVFEQAIKPAIEFKEDDKGESKFRAVKVDDVEHINDINDEIIAQIRRSRFMVCDLTGYRGGVYFEAGFAYGLGLDVIYTCRKDWTKEEVLKDLNGNPVESLYDRNGKEIRVRKQGVHFDLAHRNRIQWEPDKLDDFRKALENRIKAVIY